ncbi:MAG: T9SS type A sorting domain-containing protein [Bacteroidia bacterium]|nr:T9SS type A sorting domain-containing protein [Bacteroidia bacterium]
MKKLITVLLLSAAILTSKAQTTVNSYNASDSVWEKSNSPYLITGQITVPSGKILTIEQGVQVVFKGNYSLVVNGDLKCMGTAMDKIEFTGDSIDINTFVYWGYINAVNPISGPEKFFNMKYCVFKYGKGIKVEGNTKNTIDNCEFYTNFSCFETFTNGGSSIDSLVNCKFMNNQIVFSYYKVDKTAVVNCDFSKNEVFNIQQQRRFSEITGTRMIENGITTFAAKKIENTLIQKCSCYQLQPLGTNCNNLKITVEEMKHSFVNNFNDKIFSLYVNKEISSSAIRGLIMGVRATASSSNPVLIHNNKIQSCSVAIQLSSANKFANTVTCNEIAANEIGLVFSKNQIDDVRNNTFCNIMYDAVNTSSQPQNLTRNYFCPDNIGFSKELSLIDKDDSSFLGAINYNVYNSGTKQVILKVVAKDKSILTQADTTTPIDTACLAQTNWIRIDLNTNDTVCTVRGTTYFSVNPTVSSILYDNSQLVLIKQSSNVNPNVLGLYKEVYVASDMYLGTTTKTRYVLVSPDCSTTLEILLNTDDTICVELNSQYDRVNPSVQSALFDNSMISLTLIFSNVNSSVPGFYYEEYKAVDPNGTVVTKRRYVLVRFGCTGGNAIFDPKGNDKYVKVYPNPANSEINVSVLNGKESSFALLNSQGRVVWSSAEPNQLSHNIQVQNFSNGIYFLLVNNATSHFYKKIIIQH